jgi:hypothetical protein
MEFLAAKVLVFSQWSAESTRLEPLPAHIQAPFDLKAVDVFFCSHLLDK